MISTARKAALRGYLDCLAAASTMTVLGGDRDLPARVTHAIKAARLVDIGPGDYVNLRHAVGRWFTEQVAKVPWRPTADDTPTKEEMEHYVDAMHREIPHAAFPERLPFESTFLYYGGPPQAEIRPKAAASHLLIENKQTWNAVTCSTIGHLVLDTGFVYEFLDDLNGEDVFIHEIRCGQEKRWFCWLSTAPWLIAVILAAIEDAGTLVAQPRQLSERMHFEREVKKARYVQRLHHDRLVPPPYYVVRIEPHVVEQVAAHGPPKPHRGFSHRFRVREHWLHKIRRGTLPCPEGLALYMHRVGYRFYHALAPLDAFAIAILRQFNQAPPAAGEWLAIKRTRRREAIKGPADKPLIESSYRFGRKVRQRLPLLKGIK